MEKRVSKGFSIMLVLTLCVALGLSLFVPSLAAAQETPTLTAQSKSVHRGQTFSIDVTLDGNQGVTGVGMYLKYDTSAMKLINYSRGTALSSMNLTVTNRTEWQPFAETKGILFLWDGIAPDKSNGAVLTLIFESFITAETGDYTIDVWSDPDNTRSEYGQELVMTDVDGVVTLLTGEYSVQYYDWDGTLLQEKDYNDGDVPSYTGTTPTRETDEMYEYAFDGWEGMISEGKVLKYIAVYEKTPQEYSIFFYVDGKYFKAVPCNYGEDMDVSFKPFEQNYTFVGWFTDEECRQKLHNTVMPAHDVNLYGYQKYNIRETGIPQIEMSLGEQVGSKAVVNVVLTENSGISSMIVGVDYDPEYLTFTGYKVGSTACQNGLLLNVPNADKLQKGEDGFWRETQSGVLSSDDFKFVFESNDGENFYQNGAILHLEFLVDENAPSGVYPVGIVYDRSTAVTYINDLGEIWYSDLDILATRIIVGDKNHWEQEVDGMTDIVMDVTSQVGLTFCTVLVVKDVTETQHISEQDLQSVGKGKEVKRVYSASLQRNGVVVEESGTLTVKISLSESEQRSKNLQLYSVDQSGKLTRVDAKVQDGKMVFSTEYLSTYVLIGDAPTEKPNTLIIALLITLSALVVILVIFIAIVLVRVQNGKGIFGWGKSDDDDDDEQKRRPARPYDGYEE